MKVRLPKTPKSKLHKSPINEGKDVKRFSPPCHKKS